MSGESRFNFYISLLFILERKLSVLFGVVDKLTQLRESRMFTPHTQGTRLSLSTISAMLSFYMYIQQQQQREREDDRTT